MPATSLPALEIRPLVIQWGIHPTPAGDALFAISAGHICALHFTDPHQPASALLHPLLALSPEACLEPDASATASVAAEVSSRMRGRPREVLSLLPYGTPFQRRVWQALLGIPAGTVVTYSDIAARIGAPAAVRAAASAIAANPIAYLIPCHRVVRSTGALGGYRWGIPRKRALLEIEKLQSPDTIDRAGSAAHGGTVLLTQF